MATARARGVQGAWQWQFHFHEGFEIGLGCRVPRRSSPQAGVLSGAFFLSRRESVLSKGR